MKDDETVIEHNGQKFVKLEDDRIVPMFETVEDLYRYFEDGFSFEIH